MTNKFSNSQRRDPHDAGKSVYISACIHTGFYSWDLDVSPKNLGGLGLCTRALGSAKVSLPNAGDLKQTAVSVTGKCWVAIADSQCAIEAVAIGDQHTFLINIRS